MDNLDFQGQKKKPSQEQPAGSDCRPLQFNLTHLWYQIIFANMLLATLAIRVIPRDRREFIAMGEGNKCKTLIAGFIAASVLCWEFDPLGTHVWQVMTDIVWPLSQTHAVNKSHVHRESKLRRVFYTVCCRLNNSGKRVSFPSTADLTWRLSTRFHCGGCCCCSTHVGRAVLRMKRLHYSTPE